jgi:transposase-like protein
MSSYRIRIDLNSALAAPRSCPGCASGELEAVPSGDRSEFHCRSCGRTWRVELGRVCQVAEGTNLPQCASD